MRPYKLPLCLRGGSMPLQQPDHYQSENVPKRFGAFAPHGPVPVPPPRWQWNRLMQLALAEAIKAGQNGEVPVGALVVSSAGQILAQAGNGVESLNDPTAHAEILALRSAASLVGNCRLTDCILVVTLEPCLMCLGACAHARLSGLVYGAYDYRAGAVSSCADLPDLPIAGRKLWHMGGVLADNCVALLQDFFARRR